MIIVKSFYIINKYNTLDINKLSLILGIALILYII